MRGILDLVNGLLQRLIKDRFHSKTFPTANEAIEALARYNSRGSIQSGTVFVTIHVHGLRTSLPHHVMIEALVQFFRYYKVSETIDGISQTTIVQLIQLVLDNQYCVYEKRLYRQTTGSSMDSPLITTLVDIYLFHWQYDLLRRLRRMQDRFFGRCLNKMIFAWNDSRKQLVAFLNQNNLTHSNHPDIRLTVSMGYRVQYLDAEISHHQGMLQTRVYHHPTFEPYALPYLSEIRTAQSHASLLRAALFRAVLYCSSVREFESERLLTELSFLLNDVSLCFIQQIMEHFFLEFRIGKRGMDLDENAYQFLRKCVRDNYQQHSEYHLQRRQRSRPYYM